MRWSQWRRRRDLNPRTREGLLFSRQVHSAALPRLPAQQGSRARAAGSGQVAQVFEDSLEDGRQVGLLGIRQQVDQVGADAEDVRRGGFA